ncbi:unnamed protein product [Alopecurus aequalis]
MDGKDKRLSSVMLVGNNGHIIDKERAETMLSLGNQAPRQGVEEEREEGEVVHGDDCGAAATKALVPFTPGPSQQIDVRFDVMLLHCQACRLPLKPPVFQCKYGHVVCCYCHGDHKVVCGHADIHCGAMDAFICASKVACAYRGFGCDSYVVYHEVEAHMRACHYAPCACPEPACGFLGTPPVLLDHFVTGHFWPIFVVRYGSTWDLKLPLSQRWHVVVGQEDESVFLVTLGEIGARAIAVSLVCVRTDGAAAAASQFWCKISVEHPGGDKDKVVLMALSVSSTTLVGGGPVPGQGMFLAVPRELISGEMLAISIRIDQVHSR